MKATLNFDLTDVDDREEHFRCVKSLDMALALYDMSNYLRAIYNGKTPPQTDEQILNRFNEILEEWNININELVT